MYSFYLLIFFLFGDFDADCIQGIKEESNVSVKAINLFFSLQT